MASELQKAIKAKQAEIESMMDEAAQAVAAEQKARAELAALEAEKTIKARKGQTEQEKLLSGLDKYRLEHRARIDKIKSEISLADDEAARIGAAMQQAAAESDTEKAVALADRKHEIEARKRNLVTLLQSAEDLPIFPPGAIRDEWAAICAQLLPEWDRHIESLRHTVEAYTAEADALLRMADVIKYIRGELNKAGGYCDTFFTSGKTAEGLTIDRTYAARIGGLFISVIGQAI